MEMSRILVELTVLQSLVLVLEVALSLALLWFVLDFIPLPEGEDAPIVDDPEFTNTR